MLLFFKKNAERSKQQSSVGWNPEFFKQNFSGFINTSDVKDVFGYVYKLGDQWDRGQTDASLIRYILGLSNVSRQGKIFNTVPKKAYVTSTFADRKILEFKIELAANTFTNYRRTCIVLPLTKSNK